MKGKDIKKDCKIIISEAVTKTIHPVHEDAKKSFMFAKGIWRRGGKGKGKEKKGGGGRKDAKIKQVT
jgi:hypothetical protein